jgi:hypothetical protein
MTDVDLDLLAANLRADSSDLDAFVESLATKLEDAMPRRTKVDRARRGMFGPKEVRRISVDAGDRRLELVCGERDQIETRRARLSGGIVLKSETLDTDEWLRELGAAMTAEAQRSEQTRQALERLLLD